MTSKGANLLQSYDVIVIGAGPAGLMAARKTSEKGASTLLLEKNLSLGVKACGEAVSGQTIKDAGVTPKSSFICNDVRGIFVYAPDERRRVEIYSKELGFSAGHVIEKHIFLKEMAAQTARGGAEIWMGAQVEEVGGGAEGYRVTVKRSGEKLTLEAKMVIGCDGANSVLARGHFDRKGFEIIPSIQYKMVNCHLPSDDILEIFVGHEVAPLGYAWIFPKGDGSANVGIGVRGKPAKPYLDKFIANHPDRFNASRIVEIQGGPVPVSGQIPHTVKGGLLLCGDAAGQVIPLTGGGVHSSIAAGGMAGEAAVEALNSDSSQLGRYEGRYKETWVGRIENSLKALKLIERLSDKELNMLAEVLTGQDIVDLANGFNIKRVGFKLAKHPIFATKLAEALLR